MTAKKLGIWMDHSSANLMEFPINPIITKTIESTFTPEVRGISLRKGENLMHNKEQREMTQYYDTLEEVI